MGRYVEKHLYENELIVEKARRDNWGLIGWWTLTAVSIAAPVAAIVLGYKTLGLWLCLLPVVFFFVAFIKSIQFTHKEFVLTNKRVIHKQGVFGTQALDAPLNKIVDVYVKTTFWGRVFNTNRIRITTECNTIEDKIRNADDFKGTILGQMDHAEEEKLARQAAWTAQMMAKVMPGQNAVVEKPKKQPPQTKKRRRDDEYEF